MSEAGLIRALKRGTAAMERGDDEVGPVRFLDRGGIRIAEVDLTDAKVAAGVEMKATQGWGMRMLRHGSNPGARLELSFGNNKATEFWAPGQVVRGGFSTASVKRAKNSARVGKATIALFSEEFSDLSEDLLITALGPVDLLGGVGGDNNDVLTFVTIAEDTDPNAAYASQTGAFDGSGWELLRVLIDGQSAAANFTTADLVAWFNPSWTGTTWFECGYDGRYSIPDTDTSGGRYRCLNVPWAGRGVGCFSVRNLLAAARTGLGLIVQGIR